MGSGSGSTTIAPAPDPCENSGCSVQTYYGTPDTLALFTKNIFAIWWDPKHDHLADADWFTPPGDLTARGWAYNVFNINNTQTATYQFELEGDAAGSQGAPSFFLGRVVVMSSSGPDYSDMTMTSGLSGTATVSVKPKHKSLFLVVASVPEFFSSYQHYGYKVRITKQ